MGGGSKGRGVALGDEGQSPLFFLKERKMCLLHFVRGGEKKFIHLKKDGKKGRPRMTNGREKGRREGKSEGKVYP